MIEARKFIARHRQAMEVAPLQIYTSLIFSHGDSLMGRFSKTYPKKWISSWSNIKTDIDSCVQNFEGHRGAVESITFSSSGHLLASGSEDTKVKVWSIHTGTCYRTLDGHTRSISDVIFSFDNEKIASGSYDGTIRIWDVESGTCQHILGGDPEWSCDMASARTMRHFASSWYNGTIMIWDFTTGELLQTLDKHPGMVFMMAFGRDDQQLISGSSDQKIRIWDLCKGLCLRAFNYAESHLELLSVVSPLPALHNLDHIVAVKELCSIALWNPYEDEPFRHFDLDVPDAAFPVFFSQSGDKFGFVLHSEVIEVYDTLTNRPSVNFDFFRVSIESAAFSPVGQYIASGLSDGMIKLWNIATPSEESSHIFNAINLLISSPNGKFVATLNYYAVHIWDITTATCVEVSRSHLPSPQGMTEDTRNMCFSADSQRLLLVSDIPSIQIWEVATGRLLGSLAGLEDEHFCHGLTPSPSINQVAYISSAGTISIWDIDAGSRVLTIRVRGYNISSLAYCPDGTRLASVADDSHIDVWEVSTGRLLVWILVKGWTPESIAFSPDGKRIAGMWRNELLQLWDSFSGVSVLNWDKNDILSASRIHDIHGMFLQKFKNKPVTNRFQRASPA